MTGSLPATVAAERHREGQTQEAGGEEELQHAPGHDGPTQLALGGGPGRGVVRRERGADPGVRRREEFPTDRENLRTVPP